MSQIVAVALTQLGVKEKTGKNDGTPAERYMRGDALAWCAGFVLWCLDKAGYRFWKNAAEFYPMRNAQTFEQETIKRGWWSKDRAPEPGDVIFFKTRGASDAGTGGHVGIVERIEGDTIHTVEGNLGNMVAQESHLMTSQRISGYARIPIAV